MEKILIVDDDAELRETVSILLERERFIPIQAVDGQSGLEKAFGTRELLARIRAVLRRSASDGARVVRFDDVEVDVERRSVTRAGAEVKVTPAEYNLLLFFLQNVDRVLTRDLILNSVWGYEY